MLGERLSQLIPFEALKVAAGAVLLSPYLPLLFMGEEYGETRPFLYFVSHGDADLVEAVRQGRKAEFRDFHAQGEPPDAVSPDTFLQVKHGLVSCLQFWQYSSFCQWIKEGHYRPDWACQCDGKNFEMGDVVEIAKNAGE
jgi:1,4-alpha-glucan branching enzyme